MAMATGHTDRCDGTRQSEVDLDVERSPQEGGRGVLVRSATMLLLQ